MTDTLQEHIGWLKLYVLEMDENNWRDMRNHCTAQLRMLSDELSRAAPAQDRPHLNDQDKATVSHLLHIAGGYPGDVNKTCRDAADLIERLLAAPPLTSALRE